MRPCLGAGGNKRGASSSAGNGVNIRTPLLSQQNLFMFGNNSKKASVGDVSTSETDSTQRNEEDGKGSMSLLVWATVVKLTRNRPRSWTHCTARKTSDRCPLCLVPHLQSHGRYGNLRNSLEHSCLVWQCWSSPVHVGCRYAHCCSWHGRIP